MSTKDFVFSDITRLLANLNTFCKDNPEAVIRTADEVLSGPMLVWKAWKDGECISKWSIALSSFEATICPGLVPSGLGGKELATLLRRYQDTSRRFSERLAYRVSNKLEINTSTQEAPSIDVSQSDDLRTRSGAVSSDDTLVSFLYNLLRDHLPAGTVEEILVEDVEPFSGQVVKYTNGHLARYAMDLAKRLRT